jgi:hypothetical protein
MQVLYGSDGGSEFDWLGGSFVFRYIQERQLYVALNQFLYRIDDILVSRLSQFLQYRFICKFNSLV